MSAAAMPSRRRRRRLIPLTAVTAVAAAVSVSPLSSPASARAAVAPTAPSVPTAPTVPVAGAPTNPYVAAIPALAASQRLAQQALSGSHRVTLVLASAQGPAGASTLAALAGQQLSQDLAVRAGQLAQRRAAVLAAAPARSSAQAVVDYAAAHGLTVQGDTSTTVTLTGDPARLATLFGTHTVAAHFRSSTTRAMTVGVGHAGGLAVPAALSDAVTAVVGLSDAPAGYAHAIPTDPGAFTGPGITGRYGSLPYAGADGHGVRVGIFEAAPATVSASDFTTYTKAAGTPQTPLPVSANVNPGVPALGSASGDASVESMLDVEAVAGVAPAAQSVIYSSNNDAAGQLATLAKMADDATAGTLQLVSDSYGTCEPIVYDAANDSLAQFSSDDAQLARMTAAGATFLSASGDSGAYDCDTDMSSAAASNGHVAVDFPSSDPYTVSVGGTNAAGPRDTVWNGAQDADPDYNFAGSGSGGGVSEVFKQPAYQQGVHGIIPDAEGDAARNVPDLSALGDPATGFEIYNAANGSHSSSNVPAGWLEVGGTSLASPLVAGWIADALSLYNVPGRGASATGLGDIHAELYAHPEDFFDVTSGNNFVYTAAPGYDQASGLGVPNLQRLTGLLIGAPVADPVIGLPTYSRSAVVPVTDPALGDRHFAAFRLTLGADSCATPPTGNAASVPGTVSLPPGPSTVTLVSRDVTGACHVSTAHTVVDGIAPTLTTSVKPVAHSQLAIATVASSDTGSGLGSLTVTIKNLDTGHVVRTLHNAGSYSFNAGGGRYGISGTAVDLAGNSTGLRTSTSTVDPGLDDRQLKRSGSWKSVHAGGVLDSTESNSTRPGASLRFASYVVGGHAQRISVLTADGRGQLTVLIDGKVFGTVSPGHHRTIKLAKHINPGKHSITLVLKSGHVSIDGLVIS